MQTYSIWEYCLHNRINLSYRYGTETPNEPETPEEP